MLNGIKVIKLYAWEPPVEETIEKIRHKELALIKKAALARAIVDTFNTASPFLVCYCIPTVSKFLNDLFLNIIL